MVVMAGSAIRRWRSVSCMKPRHAVGRMQELKNMLSTSDFSLLYATNQGKMPTESGAGRETGAMMRLWPEGREAVGVVMADGDGATERQT